MEQKNSNKKLPFILCLVTVLVILVILVYNSKSNNVKNNTSNNVNTNNTASTTTSKTTKNIKGNFSREIFSGNTFDYITSNDTATFTFKNDSTFEVDYKLSGNKYQGTYEVYNGFFITPKTTEISEDTSIKNGEMLAKDINNISNSMMTDSKSILNTYLLWLTVDDQNILQPFVLIYNEETKTGTAVNIIGRTQGSFTLK